MTAANWFNVRVSRTRRPIGGARSIEQSRRAKSPVARGRQRGGRRGSRRHFRAAEKNWCFLSEAMQSLNLYHLSVLVVPFMLGAVLLWFIIRDSKKFKLNINIEADVLPSIHSNVNGSPFEPTRFQLVWRGTKKFPDDWDRMLLNFINRREQFAMTFQLLGRKLTLIVDSRNHVIGRGESGRLLLTFVDPDPSANFGNRFSDAQIPLPATDTIGEKGNQHSECANDRYC